MADTIDARVGTPLWGLNTFRSEILTKLIVDLLRAETGFSEDEKCQLIRHMLFVLLDAIRNVPEGAFTKDKLIIELSKFERIYIDWNNIEGEDMFAIKKRKELLKALRLQRYKITKTIRRGQLEFYNLLDELLIARIYEGVQKVVIGYPRDFKSMAVAYNRYTRKLKEVSNS